MKKLHIPRITFLLLTLLMLVPSLQADAQSNGTRYIGINITKVKKIRGFGNEKPDFYAKIWIDGDGIRTSTYNDRTEVYPQEWEWFASEVAPSKGVVEVCFQVWDKDGGMNFGDDQATVSDGSPDACFDYDLASCNLVEQDYCYGNECTSTSHDSSSDPICPGNSYVEIPESVQGAGGDAVKVDFTFYDWRE